MVCWVVPSFERFKLSSLSRLSSASTDRDKACVNTRRNSMIGIRKSRLLGRRISIVWYLGLTRIATGTVDQSRVRIEN